MTDDKQTPATGSDAEQAAAVSGAQPTAKPTIDSSVTGDEPAGSRLLRKSPTAAIKPEKLPTPPRTPKHKLWRNHPMVVGLSAVFTTLVLLIIVGAGGLIYGRAKFVEPGPLMQERIVNIPRGMGLRDIAETLQREGVIAEALVFGVGVVVTGAKDEIKAGEYAFPKGATMQQVVDVLIDGKVIQHQITLPEGLTSEQIVNRLMENTILTGQVKEMPREGTLLPETYRFPRGTTREQLLALMQQQQRRILGQIWDKRAPDLPVRTAEQLVVLASVIEKETGKADERPRVAGVFVNRLNQRMKLQSDPTVIYGLVGGKGMLGRGLLESELRRPTPYNTYVIEGLPPGPIANPGRAALEAAANPAKTRDIFFVADGTGGHVFAETLEQHNRNVARWRQIEAQQKGDGAPAAAETPAASEQQGLQLPPSLKEDAPEQSRRRGNARP